MPITGTSTLLRADPPLCPASVLWPSWDLHLGSSLSIEATGSQVTYPSQDRTRATFMPDATLAVSGSPPALIPGQRLLPGFDVVPTLSTLRRWFTCVRLPDPHLTQSRRAFSLTLTTGALDPSRSRWFGACLRRPAPRGLPSSRTHIAWRTSSSPGEFHPQALTEPDGSLSTHPALITRPGPPLPAKFLPIAGLT
jgi:hypothetical protein